jgi:hypothetical protein
VDEGPLYQKLDRVVNTSKRYSRGSGSMASFGDSSSSGSFGGSDSLNDGMKEMLSKTALEFRNDDDDGGDGEWDKGAEEWDEEFEFRPDVDFRRGSTYNIRVRWSLFHQCVVT